MRVLRSYPVLCFTLVLVSLIALCLAQGNVGLLVVSGALAALSWYITEGPRSKHLPRWVSNVLVIAVSLHVVVDLLQNRHDVLSVLGRFIVLLTLIKLYERRTARDHAQLLTLSLLLMVTGCLQSSDLIFGGLLVIYAVLGMYVLLLHQLYAAHDENRSARLEAMPEGYRLAPSMRPVTGRAVASQFRWFVSALTIVGFAVSVSVFVLFPRGVGQDLIPQMQGPSASRRLGFTETINLLTGTRITDSRSVAMEVVVLDEHDHPMEFARPLLLRGSVLKTYEGNGSWEPSSFQSRRIETPDEGMQNLAEAPLEQGRTLTVVLEPYIRTEVLFAPMLPVAVEHGGAADVRFDPTTQILRTAGNERSESYSVQFQPSPSDRTLEVMGLPQHNITGRNFSRTWPRESREVLRDVQPIARALLTDAGVATTPPLHEDAHYAWVQQVARAFMNHLQSDAFSYTLDLSDVVVTEATNPDPVIQFLTETKRGHCEYFASAMTLLCQSVGVDARVVTGFVAYEYDPAAEAYLVLQSNAHAWVEVRTSDRRFSTYDPTPPDTLEQLHSNAASITDRLRWVYERFDGAWSEQIIEFDRGAQQKMTQNLDERWSARMVEALESMRDWAAGVNRAFRFGAWGYIWLGLVALAVVIAVIAVVKVTRRLLAIRRRARLEHVNPAEQRRLLRQLGFYVDMLSVLHRAKIRKPRWQPPLMYAGVVATERPDAGAAMRDITELFYAARFGGRHLSRHDVSQARRRVENLAEQLNVRVPR